ncbi:MAG: hypothetical protein V2A73_13070, partial [Pseudomonadota bacterium]
VPRDTSARVAAVARLLREDAGPTRERLGALGELSRAGREALLSGQMASLGSLFNRAQELLAELGLSTPEIDRLCLLARRASAAGAKLTGAGGGGAVIAIGNEAQVVEAWRVAGFEAMVLNVGCQQCSRA